MTMAANMHRGLVTAGYSDTEVTPWNPVEKAGPRVLPTTLSRQVVVAVTEV